MGRKVVYKIESEQQEPCPSPQGSGHSGTGTAVVRRMGTMTVTPRRYLILYSCKRASRVLPSQQTCFDLLDKETEAERRLKWLVPSHTGSVKGWDAVGAQWFSTCLLFFFFL